MKNLLITLIIALTTLPALAASKTLNIYVWSNYIPSGVIQKFQKKTGITVNVSEFDDNEALYTKLKAAPNAGYDLIQPSSYYVAKMRKEGMLHKIATKKLPNFKYMNPALLNKAFDPNNQYSVPYIWGTTGIVVNKNYPNLKNIRSWTDLWDPKYKNLLKNQLLILDDLREAFAIALITLNHSINDTNPKHIKQAYLKLKQLMPQIKLFNADSEQSLYIDEDVIVGMGWNGDINLAQKENPNLKYIYPSDGFAIWMDCFSIPKNAPHAANAYKFLNFIMRPSIAKEIAVNLGYSSPNLAAVKLFPKSMYNNPTVNPSKDILKRGRFMNDLGKANSLYTKYWELLKIGA